MRKQEEEHEKENSERWLLTYSDMITLLLALFIMMYTMSTIDTSKFKAISDQLNVMLGQGNNVVGVSGVNSSNDEILNSFNVVVTDTPSATPSASASASSSAAGGTGNADKRTSIEDKLQSLIDSSGIGKVVSIESEQRGIVVSFQEALLFPSGSADVSSKGRSVLKKIAGIIRTVDNYISVEGSTDNVPIRSSRFPSNWELASQRAINVVKLLIKYDVPTKRVSATSYGQYRPVVKNSTNKNKARNRRVDIVFIDEQFDDLQAGYKDNNNSNQ